MRVILRANTKTKFQNVVSLVPGLNEDYSRLNKKLENKPLISTRYNMQIIIYFYNYIFHTLLVNGIT